MAVREFYHNEALSETSHTGDTNWYDKLSLTFTAQATADYLIIATWSAYDTGNDKCATRLYNSTSSTELYYSNWDSYGFSGGSAYRNFVAIYVESLTSSTSYTYKIQHKAHTSSTYNYIKNACLTAIKLTSDDKYNVSAGSTEDTEGTTYVTKNTLTFTPPSQGDYLILCSAILRTDFFDSDVIYPTYRILDDSSTEQCLNKIRIDAMQFYADDVYEPVFGMFYKNLTASSKTFKTEFRSNYYNPIPIHVSCKQAVLVALRISGFDDSAYTQKTESTSQSTTNTSYVEINDSLDATGKSTTAHWLKLWFCRAAVSSSSNTPSYETVDFTGSGEAQTMHNAFTSSSLRLATGFAITSSYDPNGTSVMAKMDSSSGSYTTYAYGNRLFFLRLDTGSTFSTKTPALAYKVKTTPSKQIGLVYKVLTKPTKQLGLTYVVRSWVYKNPSLAYKVRTITTKTPALKYCVPSNSTIQRGLVYRLKIYPTKQLSLAYAVRATITKPLKYCVFSHPTIQKGLSYEIAGMHTLQKSLGYRVFCTHTLQRGLQYVVPGPISSCELPLRAIHGKVTITYSEPFTGSLITVTSSGEAYGTDDQDVKDVAHGAPYKWMSVQENVLDGSYHPMPDTTVGWWSSTKADGSGDFGTAVWVQYVFDNVQIIDSLAVKGDDKLEGYPKDFTIKLYDGSNVLQHTETVTGNTSVNWSTTITQHTGIKKALLEVTKINKANVSCRITEFTCAGTFEETYQDDELFYIEILEEFEYEGSTIPIGNVSSNEITVRIKNTDGKFDLDNPLSTVAPAMLKNRKIQAWLGVEIPFGGTIEWFSMGVFWSQDWRVSDDSPYVEVVGLDRLSLLASGEFYTTQIYTSQTLNDLAELVLSDALVSASDYSIDSSLDSITIPYTWFNRTTHRNALREIAEAALAVLYCDRDGKIILKPFANATTTKAEITSDKYFTKNNPIAWNEIVNYVEVQAQPRVLGSLEEIYNDAEVLAVPAGGTATKFCIFNTDDPCTEVATPEFTQSSTHITISSHTDYTWATEIVFANSGGTSENVLTVTIDGKRVSVSGDKGATAEDESSIRLNGRQALSSPIENQFIQTKARAQDIADDILESFKDPRKDVELDCRGYVSLYLGDKIKVPTYDDYHLQAYTVTRQNIRWDGSMRAFIRGRKISS